MSKKERKREGIKEAETCKTEILALKSGFPAVFERSANTGSLFPHLTAVTVDWGGTAAAPFVQSGSPLVPHPGPLHSLTRPLPTFEMSILVQTAATLALCLHCGNQPLEPGAK